MRVYAGPLGNADAFARLRDMGGATSQNVKAAVAALTDEFPPAPAWLAAALQEGPAVAFGHRSSCFRVACDAIGASGFAPEDVKRATAKLVSLGDDGARADWLQYVAQGHAHVVAPRRIGRRSTSPTPGAASRIGEARARRGRHGETERGARRVPRDERVVSGGFAARAVLGLSLRGILQAGSPGRHGRDRVCQIQPVSHYTRLREGRRLLRGEGRRPWSTVGEAVGSRGGRRWRRRGDSAVRSSVQAAGAIFVEGRR